MSNLHMAGVLSWLAYSFCGLSAFWVGWTVWKRQRPRAAEKIVRFLETLRKVKAKGAALLPLPAWTLTFVGVWAAIMSVAATTYHTPYVTETHHNVHVLQRLAPDMWSMRDDEHGQQVFRYTACADFDNSTVIWPGYVATTAVWVEEGRCKSIRNTVGFTWATDGHGNVLKLDGTYDVAKGN